MKIFVGNLSYRTTEDDLRSLFERHGTVDRVSIVIERETGRSRGFGFVEMTNDSEAEASIKALHGRDFEGRALTVNEARSKNEGGGRANSGGYRRNQSGW